MKYEQSLFKNPQNIDYTTGEFGLCSSCRRGEKKLILPWKDMQDDNR